MPSNAELFIFIFGTLFALFIILSRVLKSKDTAFMNDLIHDLELMQERHWEKHIDTKENRKELVKFMKKYLKENCAINPGVKCSLNTDSDATILLVKIKSIWSVVNRDVKLTA